MSGSPRKATNEQLVSAYSQFGNIWRVADCFGMCGQSVHERLQKLGVIVPKNIFTKEDDERIVREYELFASVGKVVDLADAMGRTRFALCRRAGVLGLTNPKRKRPWVAVWKYISDEAANVIWEDFKATKLCLGAYCKKRGYDDLGFARIMRARYADEWDYVIELKAPKQTKYRFGREFEYRARDDLRKRGFFVLRSPRSNSPTDLVAVRKNCVLFVQCKRSGALGVVEWNQLFDLAGSVGALPLLAMIPSVQRGVEYFRLIGRKDGSKRAQPMEPISFESLQ